MFMLCKVFVKIFLTILYARLEIERFIEETTK